MILHSTDKSQLTEEEYLYAKAVIVLEGSGPKNSICLVMISNGIGDDICAMPIVAQKVKDGFDVTVVGKALTAECFTSVGAKHIAMDEPMIGWIDEHLHEYGAVYSMKEWCLSHEWDTKGYTVKDRFEQLAEILATSVPDTFSWREVLNVGERSSDHTLFALEATSKFRSYHRSRELMRRIEGPVLECKSGTFSTFREILNAVNSATKVVGVDSGILNIALALGIPCVGVFGPTDEQFVAFPYERFVPVDIQIVRKEMTGCDAPCSFMPARGYGKPCLQFAECMRSIMPQEIAEVANAV